MSRAQTFEEWARNSQLNVEALESPSSIEAFSQPNVQVSEKQSPTSIEKFNGELDQLAAQLQHDREMLRATSDDDSSSSSYFENSSHHSTNHLISRRNSWQHMERIKPVANRKELKMQRHFSDHFSSSPSITKHRDTFESVERLRNLHRKVETAVNLDDHNATRQSLTDIERISSKIYHEILEQAGFASTSILENQVAIQETKLPEYERLATKSLRVGISLITGAFCRMDIHLTRQCFNKWRSQLMEFHRAKHACNTLSLLSLMNVRLTLAKGFSRWFHFTELAKKRELLEKQKKVHTLIRESGIFVNRERIRTSFLILGASFKSYWARNLYRRFLHWKNVLKWEDNLHVLAVCRVWERLTVHKRNSIILGKMEQSCANFAVNQFEQAAKGFIVCKIIMKTERRSMCKYFRQWASRSNSNAVIKRFFQWKHNVDKQIAIKYRMQKFLGRIFTRLARQKLLVAFGFLNQYALKRKSVLSNFAMRFSRIYQHAPATRCFFILKNHMRMYNVVEKCISASRNRILFHNFQKWKYRDWVSKIPLSQRFPGFKSTYLLLGNIVRRWRNVRLSSAFNNVRLQSLHNHAHGKVLDAKRALVHVFIGNDTRRSVRRALNSWKQHAIHCSLVQRILSKWKNRTLLQGFNRWSEISRSTSTARIFLEKTLDNWRKFRIRKALCSWTRFVRTSKDSSESLRLTIVHRFRAYRRNLLRQALQMWSRTSKQESFRISSLQKFSLYFRNSLLAKSFRTLVSRTLGIKRWERVMHRILASWMHGNKFRAFVRLKQSTGASRFSRVVVLITSSLNAWNNATRRRMVFAFGSWHKYSKFLSRQSYLMNKILKTWGYRRLMIGFKRWNSQTIFARKRIIITRKVILRLEHLRLSLGFTKWHEVFENASKWNSLLSRTISDWRHNLLASAYHQLVDWTVGASQTRRSLCLRVFNKWAYSMICQAFRTWTSYASQQKSIYLSCKPIIRGMMFRKQLLAMNKWKSVMTRDTLASRVITSIIKRMLQRNVFSAFYSWKTRLMKIRHESSLMRTAFSRWRTRNLKNYWSKWRSNCQQVDNLKGLNDVFRKMKYFNLNQGFSTWRRYAFNIFPIQRIRMKRCMILLRKGTSIAISRAAFARWRTQSMKESNVKRTLTKIFSNYITDSLCVAMNRWKSFVSIDTFVSGLVSTMMQHELSTAFRTWLSCIENQMMQSKLVKITARWQHHTISHGWNQWMKFISFQKRQGKYCLKIIQQSRKYQIGICFRRWMSFISTNKLTSYHLGMLFVKWKRMRLYSGFAELKHLVKMTKKLRTIWSRNRILFLNESFSIWTECCHADTQRNKLLGKLLLRQNFKSPLKSAFAQWTAFDKCFEKQQVGFKILFRLLRLRSNNAIKKCFERIRGYGLFRGDDVNIISVKAILLKTSLRARRKCFRKWQRNYYLWKNNLLRRTFDCIVHSNLIDIHVCEVFSKGRTLRRKTQAFKGLKNAIYSRRNKEDKLRTLLNKYQNPTEYSFNILKRHSELMRSFEVKCLIIMSNYNEHLMRMVWNRWTSIASTTEKLNLHLQIFKERFSRWKQFLRNKKLYRWLARNLFAKLNRYSQSRLANAFDEWMLQDGRILKVSNCLHQWLKRNLVAIKLRYFRYWVQTSQNLFKARLILDKCTKVFLRRSIRLWRTVSIAHGWLKYWATDTYHQAIRHSFDTLRSFGTKQLICRLKMRHVLGRWRKQLIFQAFRLWQLRVVNARTLQRVIKRLGNGMKFQGFLQWRSFMDFQAKKQFFIRKWIESGKRNNLKVAFDCISHYGQAKSVVYKLLLKWQHLKLAGCLKKWNEVMKFYCTSEVVGEKFHFRFMWVSKSRLFKIWKADVRRKRAQRYTVGRLVEQLGFRNQRVFFDKLKGLLAFEYVFQKLTRVIDKCFVRHGFRRWVEAFWANQMATNVNTIVALCSHASLAAIKKAVEKQVEIIIGDSDAETRVFMHYSLIAKTKKSNRVLLVTNHNKQPLATVTIPENVSSAKMEKILWLLGHVGSLLGSQWMKHITSTWKTMLKCLKHTKSRALREAVTIWKSKVLTDTKLSRICVRMYHFKLRLGFQRWVSHLKILNSAIQLIQTLVRMNDKTFEIRKRRFLRKLDQHRQSCLEHHSKLIQRSFVGKLLVTKFQVLLRKGFFKWCQFTSEISTSDRFLLRLAQSDNTNRMFRTKSIYWRKWVTSTQLCRDQNIERVKKMDALKSSTLSRLHYLTNEKHNPVLRYFKKLELHCQKMKLLDHVSEIMLSNFRSGMCRDVFVTWQRHTQEKVNAKLSKSLTDVKALFELELLTNIHKDQNRSLRSSFDQWIVVCSSHQAAASNLLRACFHTWSRNTTYQLLLHSTFTIKSSFRENAITRQRETFHLWQAYLLRRISARKVIHRLLQFSIYYRKNQAFKSLCVNCRATRQIDSFMVKLARIVSRKQVGFAFYMLRSNSQIYRTLRSVFRRYFSPRHFVRLGFVRWKNFIKMFQSSHRKIIATLISSKLSACSFNISNLIVQNSFKKWKYLNIVGNSNLLRQLFSAWKFSTKQRKVAERASTLCWHLAHNNRRVLSHVWNVWASHIKRSFKLNTFYKMVSRTRAQFLFKRSTFSRWKRLSIVTRNAKESLRVLSLQRYFLRWVRFRSLLLKRSIALWNCTRRHSRQHQLYRDAFLTWKCFVGRIQNQLYHCLAQQLSDSVTEVVHEKENRIRNLEQTQQVEQDQLLDSKRKFKSLKSQAKKRIRELEHELETLQLGWKQQTEKLAAEQSQNSELSVQLLSQKRVIQCCELQLLKSNEENSHLRSSLNERPLNLSDLKMEDMVPHDEHEDLKMYCADIEKKYFQAASNASTSSRRLEKTTKRLRGFKTEYHEMRNKLAEVSLGSRVERESFYQGLLESILND